MSNVGNIRLSRKWRVRKGLTVLLLVLAPLILLAQPAPDKRRAQVEIITDLGTVVVELYNETPLHRDNFLRLAKAGHYDSLLFHRVIPGFMIQGGDPVVSGKKGAMGSADEDKLPPEIAPGLIHKRGALAAARQGDDVDPGRRSHPSQFYIVQGRTYQAADLDKLEERSVRYGEPHTYSEAERHLYSTLGGAPHLDGAYTVYGQVVQGMEVVDAIAAQPVDGHDRPITDIRMYMRVK